MKLLLVCILSLFVGGCAGYHTTTVEVPVENVIIEETVNETILTEKIITEEVLTEEILTEERLGEPDLTGIGEYKPITGQSLYSEWP